MMMMPFVRLIAIYVLVGAAIFAFLKRDQIMAAINPPEDPAFAHPIAIPFAQPAADAAPASEDTAATPAPATTAPAPAATPEAQPAEAAQPESTSAQPSPSAPPAFGSQITPQYFGQTAAPAAPAPTAAPTDNMVARWTKAREVFSQGNPAEAATLYEALTADYPDNADLHGETGNLYYNLGQFNKAAIHYEAVGEISARAGNMKMANAMLTLLQRISPTKAAELQAVLNGG